MFDDPGRWDQNGKPTKERSTTERAIFESCLFEAVNIQSLEITWKIIIQ